MTLGLVATALVGMALGAVLALLTMDKPVPARLPIEPVAIAPPPPVVPARAPLPAPPPIPVSAAAPPAAPAQPPQPSPAPLPQPVPVAAADAPPADDNALAAALPYAVQFGAFAEIERAQHLADSLKDRGYPVQIEENKKPAAHGLHFVRLADGYKTRAEALQEAATLKRDHDIDTILVRRDSGDTLP
jgi:cell division septation protein DedD